MNSIVAALSFFATPTGFTTIGVIAAVIIIVWDWRLALVGLVIVQLGVAEATVLQQGMPAEWGAIMVGVMALATVILALSVHRTHTRTTLYQSGTWSQRGLIVTLVYASWRLLGWHMPLPEFTTGLSDLYFWLSLCMLIILGMGENPLFTALALLLWLIPVEAVVAVLLEVPALVALVGMIQLLTALACSYLILVEEAPAEEAPVITDITFPATGVGSLTIPRPEPVAAPSLPDWLWDWLWGRLRERLPTLPRRAGAAPARDDTNGDPADADEVSAPVARRQP